jgi:hypothetical protein
MRQVCKAALQQGLNAISNAGFSDKFARTLQAINKPKSGYVLNPSVYINSTINYADIFETGKTTGHRYLWLPLPSVPPIKGRPHMTPRQYIQNVGPLVLMWRPGKTPMLGATVRRAPRAQPFGRFASRAQLQKGKTGRGVTETIPLFVAIMAVVIPRLMWAGHSRRG